MLKSDRAYNFIYHYILYINYYYYCHLRNNTYYCNYNIYLNNNYYNIWLELKLSFESVIVVKLLQHLMQQIVPLPQLLPHLGMQLLNYDKNLCNNVSYLFYFFYNGSLTLLQVKS